MKYSGWNYLYWKAAAHSLRTLLALGVCKPSDSCVIAKEAATSTLQSLWLRTATKL
jgi:hypothetical protein